MNSLDWRVLNNIWNLAQTLLRQGDFIRILAEKEDENNARIGRM